MDYFITAIDTDSGKTLISAIFCEALGADYWKPVQAGLPKDSDIVKTIVSNPSTVFHPERYLLRTPASPHAAAKIDGVKIELDDFIRPNTSRRLIIEGAGGCLVPLNDRDFVIDIVERVDSEVVLVADIYLGSINHTLLTIEALKKRKCRIKGIVFNGPQNIETERIILHHSALKELLHIYREPAIDKFVVAKYASILKQNLSE
jgi:dethiobiotin synthetase